MPTKTKIEWADYVSNPLKAVLVDSERKGHACVKISEGCAHCWASTMNVRLGTGLAYTAVNLARVRIEWSDAEQVRALNFAPRGPFKNGRPRPILFVHDMIDIFGDWVDPVCQKRTWRIMEHRHDIDFVLLTKRPANMLAFVAGSAPLENVLLGTSVENQRRADERRDTMCELARRGWKTMVSYEPALGIVDWSRWWFLRWLIAGGESGNQARPTSVEAMRFARDFCLRMKIPFFFKQWGEWAPVPDMVARGMTTFKHRPVDGMVKVGKGLAYHVLDGAEWSETP